MRVVRFLPLLILLGCNLPDPGDFTDPEPEPGPDSAVSEEDPLPEVIGFAVTEVIPASGAPKGLELVEIRGGGFKDTSRVFFGGSEALDVTITSAQRIFVLTPPHTPGKVPVRVLNIDDTVAQLSPGFTYFAPIEVDRLLPAEGPAHGGVPIEIQGSGFAGTQAVLFQGREALDVQVVGDDTILCVLPTNPVGLADVHVVTQAGTARVVDGFLYFSEPRVSGFSPLAAPAAGGGTLALAGSGLVDGAQVSIGGVPAELLAGSDDGSQLVVRIPAGEPGLADIAVSTEYGGVVLERAFTWLGDDARGLLNVWPAVGPASGGGEVVLVVAGASADSDVTVTLGTPAPVTAVLPTQSLVLATAPPGEPGQVVDVVLDMDGERFTLAGAYRYEPTLVVSSISPSQGSAAGGDDVTIRGAGFHGSMAVFLGALPLVDMEVVSDTEIAATTPMGSPGFADVRVVKDEQDATLRDAFAYLAGETRIYAVTPDHGAIAGNTWVTLYGTDLPPYMDVRFGGEAAAWVERLTPTTVVARSPRAEEIGTVDVRVVGGPEIDITVPQSFTYFDPTARWGGTWGEPVDGSVNVTVLTMGDDEPVDGAVVVVGYGDPPQYKGYTDDRGQVTLSGPWLRGPIDVTAARFGSSASSVIEFDAENVTLFLTSPNPPGSGGGQPLEPGTIVGKVKGMGKYLVTPPWPCEDLDDAPPGFCEGCQSDEECPGNAPMCTSPGNQDPFCTTSCELEADCPLGFVCLPSALETARCVPDPGDLQARCFTSNPSFASPQPVADPNNTIDLESEIHEFVLTGTRLGELAIYCMAGAYRVFHEGTEQERAEFRPVVMGIQRHEFVMPAIDPISQVANPPSEVEITLDIPLSREVNVVVGEQPLRPSGPHETTVNAQLDLGSDGFVPLVNRLIDADVTELRVGGLPAVLEDKLYDAEYLFHAKAASDSIDTLPSSEVLRAELGSLDDGSWLHHDGATFQKRISGYPGDVTSLWAAASDNVMATTRSGTVIHFNGDGWSAQPVKSGPALNGIGPDQAGGAFAVGDAGRILHWDGIGWETWPAVTPRDLRAVHAFGPEAAVAVGSYVILELHDGAWSEIGFGPPKDLHDVWAPGAGDLWAAGRDGVVLKRTASSGAWSAVTVPVFDDLYGLWGTSDGLLIAVGRSGRVLQGSGDGTFLAMQAPTARTLRAVWGSAPDDVWAVGDAATVVHFDGFDWQLVQQEAIEVSLRALDGAPPGGELFAMGAHGVHLDPFLNVPTFTSPAPDQLWNKSTIAWTVDPGGAPISFDNFRIYGPTGALAWTIMSPGVSTFYLPDLDSIEGLPIFPNGEKRLILFRVEHPDFDIDDFDSRVFRLMDWRSWVLMTYSFDSPIPSLDGTLPDGSSK